MSETMAAILILPFLIALVVSLECARTGCTWLHRRVRRTRSGQPFAVGARISSAQDY